jgi:hypothetical protein
MEDATVKSNGTIFKTFHESAQAGVPLRYLSLLLVVEGYNA